ncbi:MAG: zinc ribbon domain-containing protein [Pyrinomonadaceae bacterium]
MYCPSCGNEISVELKYCNRCGANLAIPETYPAPAVKPMKAGLPAIVLGLTVTIGLGVIFSSAIDLAGRNLHPAAIAWMVIFGLATLFGCTALMLRFWLKVLSMNREIYQPQNQIRPPMQTPAQISGARQQFPPRLEPVPSVTEHTTRTFSPAYRERSDPGDR